MRPNLLILFALGAALAVPTASFAQSHGGGGGEDESKQRKKDDWAIPQGVLPEATAAGPCPYVKILYDASRYQEFTGGRESSATVGYTGEIENLRAQCFYKASEPITVRMNVLFALGRGPAAQGDTKNYRYWIAVTYRNQAVIDKQYFDMPVKFSGREDRAYQREEIGQIVIPRANNAISGANFEILVGFDVTPQMAEFNREGKRFRINAAAPAEGQ